MSRRHGSKYGWGRARKNHRKTGRPRPPAPLLRGSSVFRRPPSDSLRLVFSEPILHVDMDSFFVEVERLRDPGLIGRPVVVGGLGNRGVVASASYEARRFGVRSAMPMVAARKQCPALVVVPTDHSLYQESSIKVFEVFRSITPLVEGLSLDEAFLDVSGLHRHFPSPDVIGHEIRRRIRNELGLPASVGIAATKFVAKLASEAAKPDGLRHIPKAESLEFLHALPVRALWGVGEATHATLEAMGVETVGDLARLPAATLERRLGVSNGSNLAALARGQDPRPVVPDHDAKSISVSETYERDLTGSDEIDTELIRLCDRLAFRVRRAGLAGRTIGLTVRYSDFVTITRHHTFTLPTDTSRQLWQAVRDLKDKVSWDRPIRLLGVSVATFVDPGEPRQMSVENEPKWDDLADAVDAVRDRFGTDAVRPARLVSPDRES
jgi:DNA polymerase-4